MRCNPTTSHCSKTFLPRVIVCTERGLEGVRRTTCTALCGAANLSEALECWRDAMRWSASATAGTPVARRSCAVGRVVGRFTCRGGEEGREQGYETCLKSTLGRGRTGPACAQDHQS
jgi:hypothetical protein